MDSPQLAGLQRKAKGLEREGEGARNNGEEAWRWRRREE